MENKELKYTVCTEGSDYNFPYLRVMLLSLLKHNPWAGDSITILTCNETPLSEHNRSILNSISKNISYHEVDTFAYSEIKIKESNYKDIMHLLYKTEAFKLTDYDIVLYIKSSSLCISSLDFVFDEVGDAIFADTGHLSNISGKPLAYKARVTDINSSIMFLSKNVLNEHISLEILQRISRNRFVTGDSIDSSIRDTLGINGFDINYYELDKVIKKSKYPDSKYVKFKSILKKVGLIDMDIFLHKGSGSSNLMFKKINSIWNSYNLDIDSILSLGSDEIEIRSKIKNLNYTNLQSTNNVTKYKKDSKNSGSPSSTIIVGSGISCLDHEFGEYIDSFDNVIRFRGFIPGVNIENVGTKTTHLCFNDSAESTKNIIREYSQYFNNPRVKLIHTHNRDRLTIFSREIIRKFKNHRIHVDPVNASYIKKVFHKICKTEGIEIKSRILVSSGLCAILDRLFVKNEEMVYIHGFDFFSNNEKYLNSPYHYYDKDEKLKAKLLRLHDLNIEGRVIQSLIKKGRVTVLKGEPKKTTEL